MKFNSILETIGGTNLVKLTKISKLLNNEIYAKIESANAFGSVKDRIALNMINKAFEAGLINKDTTVIEATSGNTGIALAAICLYYEIKCVILMPEGLTQERIDALKNYGAEVILTEKALGMTGAVNKAKELNKTIKNSFIPSQFSNMNNPDMHYHTTGPEILNDLPDIDYFFAGIGTGGTISGVSKYLKEKKSNVKIIGIEPEESAVISGNPKGPHGIQGIGAGFIPDTLNQEFIDEIITVSTIEAYDKTKFLNKKEVISAGISSGAALAGVVKYVEKNKIENKKIVFVLPDSIVKYLSVLKDE